jgi:hypothetical protein
VKKERKYFKQNKIEFAEDKKSKEKKVVEDNVTICKHK